MKFAAHQRCLRLCKKVDTNDSRLCGKWNSIDLCSFCARNCSSSTLCGRRALTMTRGPGQREREVSKEAPRCWSTDGGRPSQSETLWKSRVITAASGALHCLKCRWRQTTRHILTRRLRGQTFHCVALLMRFLHVFCQSQQRKVYFPQQLTAKYLVTKPSTLKRAEVFTCAKANICVLSLVLGHLDMTCKISVHMAMCALLGRNDIVHRILRDVRPIYQHLEVHKGVQSP